MVNNRPKWPFDLNIIMEEENRYISDKNHKHNSKEDLIDLNTNDDIMNIKKNNLGTPDKSDFNSGKFSSSGSKKQSKRNSKFNILVPLSIGNTITKEKIDLMQ